MKAYKLLTVGKVVFVKKNTSYLCLNNSDIVIVVVSVNIDIDHVVFK